MGHLDEQRFGELIRACAACGAATFEIATHIDRQVSVMLGDADDARWSHDGEKLIDGVTRITCLACRAVAFASDDCPRCHAVGGLARADAPSRLEVPRRCPACNGTELMVIALCPATVKTGAGRPQPAARADLGDAGFHVMAMACDDCDWAMVADRCPLCDAPPPLRERP